MQFVKLVTFDATNTLLKFRVPPWIYYKIVAQKYGYNIDHKIIKDHLKFSYDEMSKGHPNFGKNSIGWQEWWKEVVRQTFNGLVPASVNIDAIANQLIDDFKTDQCWQVSRGSFELIEALKGKGVCIGVLSNFDPRLKDVLQDLKLTDTFIFVMTSYDVGLSKPDKRIFECALLKSNLSVSPHECIHIGDNVEEDYLGAEGAGWRALLVTRSTPTASPVPHHHIFTDLKHLCTAFKNDQIIL